MQASAFIRRVAPQATRLLAGLVGSVGLGVLLAGCPGPSAPPVVQGKHAISFVYPAFDQSGIVLSAQPVVIFPGAVDAERMKAALELVDSTGDVVPTTLAVAPASALTPDGKVQGAVSLAPLAPLAPATRYTLKVKQAFTAGDSTFEAGTTLTQFTTRRLLGAGAGSLTAISHSPGNSVSDGVGGDIAYGVFQYQSQTDPANCANPPPNTPATVTFALQGGACFRTDHFANTVHVTFSEPLDPTTVVAGRSFRFADTTCTAGPQQCQIPGRLYVQGNEVAFQPTRPLTPGATYDVAFTTDVEALARGANGAAHALIPNGQSSFSLTAVPTGKVAREFLQISAAAGATSPLMPVDAKGNAVPLNSIDIASSLIGANVVTASSDPERGELVAYLSQPGGFDPDDPAALAAPDSPFFSVLPVVIPAGSQLSATPLQVVLAKPAPGNAAGLTDGVDAQLDTGPLTITLLSNANVYFFQNPNRVDGQPTAVALHLDMSMAGGDATGNAVLNQTVLNVTAVGTVVAFKGQLFANAIAQIPLEVANKGTAIASLNLQLVLPSATSVADAATCRPEGVSQDIALGGCPAHPDVQAPKVIAFSPTKCFYTFNGIGTALANTMAEGDCPSASIDGFPANGSPSIVFSEPLDPQTLLTHDADHIQLIQNGTPVAFTARVEGTSVVLRPHSPFAANATIAMSVGTGLTDLAGNALDTSDGPTTQTFKTQPWVAGPVAPAYITAINPGLPCALDPASGDFRTGGSVAGYCLGDSPASGPHQVFGIFPQQVNQPLAAFFTKPVNSTSIMPADGCLTPGSGTAATRGSFAVELVDGAGQCTGVVPGIVTIAHPGRSTTRFFLFQPNQPFTVGQRYWFVVCGTQNSACTTAERITDRDGRTLNTTPIVNSGSGPTAVAATPDLVQPFVGITATDNFSIVLQAQPEADTNGNGNFDAGENVETPTAVAVNLSLLGIPVPVPLASYLSGERPLQVQPLTKDCSAAPVSVIGSTPAECLPVVLSAGGMFNLTNIPVNVPTLVSAVPALGAALQDLLNSLGLGSSAIPPLAATGRIVLRLQGCDVSSPGCTPLEGESTAVAGDVLPHQTIYIVGECKGTIAGQAYDYKPCIAANLELNVNAPDGNNVAVPQTSLTTTLVGPLVFTPSGRLTIQLVNANTLTLNATALGIAPAVATVNPGALHLQLAAYPVHGD